MALTLYYSLVSPPSRAVLLTLKNLELEFESKTINVSGGENKSDEFLKINPQGTIPVVVDDDFPMNESRAICCYLADAKAPGNTLYPADDPKARYIIDQRLFYDASTWGPAVVAAIRPLVRGGETTIPEQQRSKILSCLETLDSFLDGFEWFSASENVSIADLSLLTTISTLFYAGFDYSAYPNISAWYERCMELPGADENEQGAQMFGNFIKSKLTEPF